MFNYVEQNVEPYSNQQPRAALLAQGTAGLALTGAQAACSFETVRKPGTPESPASRSRDSQTDEENVSDDSTMNT